MNWWRSVAIALSVLCLALGVLLYRESAERQGLSSRADTLYQQAKALEVASVMCRHQQDSLSARLAGLVPSPIHKLYVDRLRDRGLKEPIEDLAVDLQRHPELIPYPAVSGGRMGFYDRDRIRVLNDSWVYATFDDGHVAGDAILGYDVAPGGRISWRVVLARQL